MIVYGHRGASGEAPENTIAGCKHAVARGVRHIEVDLRLSKDLELVIIHDDTLKRTAGVRGKVIDYSASELAKMHASASGAPWPGKKDIGVPTLHKLYAAAPEIKRWQLELKGGSQRYNENLVAALAEWLQDDRADCIVTSSEVSLLLAMKELLPDLNTGYVSMYSDPTDTISLCGCSYLIGQWATAGNPFLVRKMHRQGVHVSAWTVNDASAIKNLYRMKVDSVITDYPSMAVPLVAALQR